MPAGRHAPSDRRCLCRLNASRTFCAAQSWYGAPSRPAGRSFDEPTTGAFGLRPVPPTPTPAFASSQLPGCVLPPCQTPVRSGLPSAVRGIAPARARGACAKTAADRGSPRAPRPCSALHRTSTAGAAAAIARARRWTEHHLLAVRQRDLARVRPGAAVARTPTETVIVSPTFIVHVASPADPVQRDGRITLELPVGDGAAVVLDVEIDVRVRVRPFDLREHARQRHRSVARRTRRRTNGAPPRAPLGPSRWRAANRSATSASSRFPHVDELRDRAGFNITPERGERGTWPRCGAKARVDTVAQEANR